MSKKILKSLAIQYFFVIIYSVFISPYIEMTTSNDTIEKNYNRYEKNYQDIYKKYPWQFLIISDEKLVNHFDKIDDAYIYWCKNIWLWKFLLQKCEQNLEVINFHWVYQLN